MTAVVAQGIPVTMPHAVRSSQPDTMPSDHVLAALAESAKLPTGLCATVARSVATHPLRIMIVDNSGSMQTADGKRFVEQGGVMRSISCSRWNELTEDVLAIASISTVLGARTDVHLLNPTRGFAACSVNAKSWDGIAPLGPAVDESTLGCQMREIRPNGGTPLTEAVMDVVSMITPIAHSLRANGQAVPVLLCTDGLPNNRQTFIQAMQQLQALPVWCVVRLCTDDDAVVDFWNDLDRALEAPLEVLDDVRGEAAEVTSLNPWLTYGPPLHMARLFGLPEKIFDAIDEESLLPPQIKEFMCTLLGVPELPEPEIDLNGFVSAVQQALLTQPRVIDPRSGKLQPWVDLRALERALRSKKCASNSNGCALM